MGFRKKSYLKMMRLFLFLIELPSTQKLEDKWEILDGLKGERVYSKCLIRRWDRAVTCILVNKFPVDMLL